MNSTFFGEPWLHGMEALVELRLQQFLLIGNKGGESKFNLPNFMQQPITAKDYAALAACVHGFLEPGKFGPDVKRVFLVKDSEEEISEVEIGPVSFAELLERDPAYCLKLNRYLEKKHSLNPDVLGRITLQHARLDEDYSAGRYELVVREKPIRNPTLTYNQGEKFDDQITEFKNNASGQQWWDGKVFRNFDWVPPIGDLAARELLWIVLFNKWHGLVLRAELSREKPTGNIRKKLKEIADIEGCSWKTPLELYEKLDAQKSKMSIADELIAHGANLIQAMEAQHLIKKSAPLDGGDVNKVLQALRNYEEDRMENRAKVGFVLVSMRTIKN